MVIKVPTHAGEHARTDALLRRIADATEQTARHVRELRNLAAFLIVALVVLRVVLRLLAGY